MKFEGECSYRTEEDTLFSATALADLISCAKKNIRKRSRLCLHDNPLAPCHQMLITHGCDEYVNPHRHNDKAETFIVLEGSVEFIIFDDQGGVVEVTEMSALGSGKPFIKIVDKGVYHSMLITSEWLVFFEITTGPFRKNACEFAKWAPSIGGNEGGINYLRRKTEEYDANGSKHARRS